MRKTNWKNHSTENQFRFKKIGPQMVTKKVLIIGAGAAGIACATKLIQNGFTNVFILESQNRIGGRIYTIPFADNFVDMGAQWCHGEENNVVYEMVKEEELLESTGDIYVAAQSIRSNGEVVPEEIVSRFKETLMEIFISRSKDLKTYEGSLDKYLTEKFYSALDSEENKDIDREIAQEFFDNFRKIESSESSGHIQEVSARGFDEYWECEGDYMLNWKAKGYQEFLKVLMKVDKESPELGILKGKIFTNIIVDNIEWDRNTGNVLVRCENSDIIYEAEHVVMTVSLGVLKERYSSLFFPPLTEEKIIPIKSIGYGNVSKIFLEFAKAFWPPEWNGFVTLWSTKHSEEIRRTDDAWLEDIYGFYRVNYQPRILLAWIVGNSAKHMESLSQKKIQEGCMKLLHRFLPTWEIPEPLNMKTTTWHSNSNFRGAYSFRSLLTEEKGTGAHALAEPLTVLAYKTIREGQESEESLRRLSVKPVVLFAGEATSSHYYSTVHGAVESGWREADRLITYYDFDSDT